MQNNVTRFHIFFLVSKRIGNTNKISISLLNIEYAQLKHNEHQIYSTKVTLIVHRFVRAIGKIVSKMLRPTLL